MATTATARQPKPGRSPDLTRCERNRSSTEPSRFGRAGVQQSDSLADTFPMSHDVQPTRDIDLTGASTDSPPAARCLLCDRPGSLYRVINSQLIVCRHCFIAVYVPRDRPLAAGNCTIGA
jgi:hypothetical protein